MISRYTLNEIAAEFERVHYAGKNPSSCGSVMITTHDLPSACELSRYAIGGELVFQTKGYVKSKSPSRKRSRPYLKDLRNLMFLVKLLSRVNFENLHTLIKTLCVLLRQTSTLKVHRRNQCTEAKDPRSVICLIGSMLILFILFRAATLQ